MANEDMFALPQGFDGRNDDDSSSVEAFPGRVSGQEGGTTGPMSTIVHMSDLPSVFEGFDQDSWEAILEEKGPNGPDEING